MKKFNENLNGMFLSEAMSGKIIESNLSLTLNVEAVGTEFKIQSSQSKPRTDGRFSLEVEFSERKEATVKTDRPELKNLIVELFDHPDTPEWLRDAMWEEINSKTSIDAYDPDQIKLMLKYANFEKRELNFSRRGQNES